MDQPRDPPAPINKDDVGKRVRPLRRDSPVSGVAAPRRSYGYASPTCGGSPAPPWIRGCRVRNATRQGFSAAS